MHAEIANCKTLGKSKTGHENAGMNKNVKYCEDCLSHERWRPIPVASDAEDEKEPEGDGVSTGRTRY
jgi:hypothetical protein